MADCPKIAQYTAAEATELMKVTVEAGDNLEAWSVGSVQAFLMGEDSAPPQRVWKPEELARFDSHKLPCWVLRPISKPGGPREVFWANAAAQQKFGRPRNKEEVLKWWDEVSDKYKPAATEILKFLHHHLQVERHKLRANMNLARTLHQNWTALPRELHASLREEALDVEIDGKVEGCYLCVVESILKAEQLRSGAIHHFSPIHSYLFCHTGELLLATPKATVKIKSRGFQDVRSFTLADLLQLNGTAQPALAKEALKKVCTKKAPHHSITLSNAQANGSVRHTLYEMWPACDPCDSLEPAMVVSAFDVTHQKQVELELEALKNSLQRHNKDLQSKVEESVLRQASLERERLALQSRLKDALQGSLAPRTHLDTSSPADRTVSLLDGLLEGREPSTQDIVELRNTLLQSNDLRRVSDLEKQLKDQGNLSEDAGRSLVALLQDDHRAAKRLANTYMSPSGTPRPWRRASSHLRRSTKKTNSGLHPEADYSWAQVPICTITPEVERLLQDASSSWGFNMLELDAATDGHSLSCFAYWLFQQSSLMEHYGLPELAMADCLKAIEKGYQNANPYHNRVHAASVLHMSHMLMNCSGGLKEAGMIEDVLEIAMYLAAICHDYGHPGLTNDFLVKSHHPLSMRYNDKSPLENHHASASFQILFDHFEHCGDMVSEILHAAGRSAIIELILATDMKQHFSIVSRIQGAFQAGAYMNHSSLTSQAVMQAVSAERAASLTAENRMLALQVALKCADVGHLALPTELHKVWVGRLQDEFYLQGDVERDRGMPISALMDRDKPSNIANSQVPFFEVVVLPLYQSLVAVLPGAQHMLNAVSENYMMWRSASEQARSK